MKKLTFGSLFAGIGGFDLGLERAGFVCKWQVELDPYARSILAKHWPNVHRWDDVRTFPQPGVEKVDVICGGFPCQDISYAGKGAGINGERSGLWFEFARVVREVGPRFVVVENVAALLTRGMGEVLGTLASLGYDAEWNCIPAAAVGAPHFRDRVFVLGWNTNSIDDSTKRSRSSDNSKPRRISNRKNKTESISDANRSRLQKWNEIGNRSEAATGIFSRRELERTYSTHRQQQWEVEPAVGRVADGISHRVDRLRCLGNAVVPQVAEYIGRTILAGL